MLALANPIQQLRGTAAMLERQKSIKRCRHLLEAWGGQRLETLERCIASLISQVQPESDVAIDMEARIQTMFEELNADALRFQDLYYSERKHLAHLDQQRCAGYTVSAIPQTDALPPAA
jgi:DNA primase